MLRDCPAPAPLLDQLRAHGTELARQTQLRSRQSRYRSPSFGSGWEDPYAGTVIDFRTAVEARDPDAIAATLADDVVFRSPVAFKPYPGKAITAAILRAVSQVFEDFRYERELAGADGRDHALVFAARVGDRELSGCDFIHLDEDGLIDELTVMVRPLSAAQALAEQMAARLAAGGGLRPGVAPGSH